MVTWPVRRFVEPGCLSAQSSLERNEGSEARHVVAAVSCAAELRNKPGMLAEEIWSSGTGCVIGATEPPRLHLLLFAVFMRSSSCSLTGPFVASSVVKDKNLCKSSIALFTSPFRL